MYSQVVANDRVILRALMYHRIEDPRACQGALNPDLVTASPRLFEQQMRHLTRFYDPIGAAELVAAVDGRHTLPPRPVVVTFDDGYRDFVEYAYPVLRQNRIPAILFVSTDFVDQPDRTFWWDALWQMLSRTRRRRITLRGPAPRALELGDWHQRVGVVRAVAEWLKGLSPAERSCAMRELAEQLEVTAESTHAVLTWPELRKLDQSSIAVAAHGRTHELLDQLDTETMRQEIEGSRDDLRREMGVSPPVFAYPNGNFNSSAIEAVRRAGFLAAFTTVRGASVVSVSNPLTLRREAGGPTLLKFVFKLTRPLVDLRTRLRALPAYAEPPPNSR